jgi:hypothetical protein
VTPCAVSTVHVEMMSVSFLVDPQNQVSYSCQWFDLKIVVTVFSGLTSKSVATVFSGLALKSVATVSPDLASKPVAQVSRFVPQNRQLRFDDLGLKITTMISWFVPQN